MAKKKQADPFSYAAAADAAGAETDESARPLDKRAGTYRIGEETKLRIDVLSEQWNVLKGDLVRYLLTYALDAVERGELQKPGTYRPGPARIAFDEE